MFEPATLNDFPGYSLDASGRVLGRSGAPLSFDAHGRVNLKCNGKFTKIYIGRILHDALKGAVDTTQIQQQAALIESQRTLYEARLAEVARKLEEQRALTAAREKQRDTIAAVKLGEIAESAARQPSRKRQRKNETQNQEEEQDDI